MSNRKLSVHTEHEFLQRLEKAGLGPIEAQSVVESKGNKLGRKVVSFIRKASYESAVSQKRAQQIMGEHFHNFLGPEEVSRHFGISFSQEELAKLNEVPFTEETLQICKDDHILVAGYPLSILDIRSRVPRELFSSHENAWCDNEKFAKLEEVNLQWYLIRKDIVPNSTDMNYREQQKLLKEGEKIPRACEMVYTIILYYLATKVRLFENLYARCQDVSSDGHRVIIGYFGPRSLLVGVRSDDVCYS